MQWHCKCYAKANRMTPNALLFSASKSPAQLSHLGLHIQRFEGEAVRELDAATTHWVYFVPDDVLERPEWSSLRVELAQANRWFIVYGGGCPPATIVRAMRDGAFDFVDTREPVERWGEATGRRRLPAALAATLRGPERPRRDRGWWENRRRCRRVMRTIGGIGPTAANVLIIGESGTGKEKAAQALHEASGLGGAVPAGELRGDPAGFD